MGVQVEIVGLDETLKRMNELPKKLRRKGLGAAMRKAANVVRNAAIQNAMRIDDPQTRENIAKNISVQASARLGRANEGIAFRVGVRGGAKQYVNDKRNRRMRRVGKKYKTDGDAKNPGGDTFYWRFIEFGTRKMAARPFMRPALANNVDAAIEVAARELSTEIDKLTRSPS